jgi:hypothetical protein
MSETTARTANMLTSAIGSQSLDRFTRTVVRIAAENTAK